MSWFLKQSDGQIYGPHEETVLRQWAADGRIGPEDQVSQDGETWYPAPDLAMLEMNWRVRLPDGSLYGPVALAALGLLAGAGELAADVEVVERSSGRVTTLREALPGVAGAVAAEPLHGAWKQLAESRDFHEHEARKWKNLYEQERARAAQTEQELTRQIRELRASEISAHTHLEQAERNLARLTEEHRRLEEALERAAGQDPMARAAAWMKAYQDLSAQYDALINQLADKTRQLQQALETCARVEAEARSRLEQMEKTVQRQQEESQHMRQRLAEVEDAHLQLVRSYRELNDRYIRAREQAAQPPSPAPGPRIKLTRE